MISVLNDKNLLNVNAISEPISENVVKENEYLKNKFDLIVASSVFGFLPEYESTLFLLKSLLTSEGMLVQWDWFSPENDSEFGLSEERINTAFKKVGFNLISISQPFSLTSTKGTMPVVMGVAKNA